MILVLFLLSFLQRPLPPEDLQSWAVFLPVVQRPFVGNGAAWAATGNRLPLDAQILHIEWYHNWGVHGVTLENGAIFVPHVWCDQYPSMDWMFGTNLMQELIDTIPDDYEGPIIFGNEPDLPGSDIGGQCDRTPRQMAYLYKQIRLAYPNAILIGPQVSHIDYQHDWVWLRGFYNQLMGMGFSLPDRAAVHTYIDGESPKLIIDSLFDMLSGYPESPNMVWVTEYGSCNPETVRIMRNYWPTDGRVERWAFFTPRWTGDGECLSAFVDNSTYTLSPVGEVMAYP